MSFPREFCFPGELDDEQIVAQLGLTPIQVGNLVFKNPQILAYRYAQDHPRLILSFDKGMGKTITYLKVAYDVGPPKLVILCGRSSMLVQKTHLEKYFPDWAKETVYVRGMQSHQRAKLWNTTARVYVCTATTFLTDMGARMTSKATCKMSQRIAPAWVDLPSTFLVADEWHRWLRNRDTGMHKILKRAPYTHIILSSGSAGGKGPQSIWTALNSLFPKVFTSYWKYIYAFCFITDTPFGKQIVAPRDVEGWRKTVSMGVFHRKKDSKDYPPKTRQALPVEMDSWQKKIHDDLKKTLFAELSEGTIVMAPNVLAATHKIRQMMICPKFLDPNLGWGAGLEAILDDAQEAELSHFVVSTPYTGPIPLLQQFFTLNKIQSYVLRGGMEMEEIQSTIQRWQQSGGVMIQSIKFAESYELPPARIMYMLGYEHDPDVNSQAEDRIHRDIRVTPDPVDIYYVKHVGSYDENIVEAMSLSADNVHALMNQPISKVFNL